MQCLIHTFLIACFFSGTKTLAMDTETGHEASPRRPLSSASAAASATYATHLEEADTDEATQRARQLLPYQDGAGYLPVETVLERLHPFISSQYEKWERALLFMKRFASPRHPPQTVTQGWQCLLAKAIRHQKDEAEQWNGLLDLMKLHEKALDQLNASADRPEWLPAFLEEVKRRPGCANCAKGRLGIRVPVWLT